MQQTTSTSGGSLQPPPLTSGTPRLEDHNSPVLATINRRKQSLESLRSMWAFRRAVQHLVADATDEEMICHGPAADDQQSSSSLTRQLSPTQTHSEPLPEQTSFFEIQFDSRLQEYIIQSHCGSGLQWFDLRSVSAFTRDNQVFRRGDYVVIAILGARDEQRCVVDIAYINEIRHLPRPDHRKLVLITWLYHYRGRYYKSNHLQIVLWDTVAGQATTEQIQKIKRGITYNACGGKRICDARQGRLWRKRKQRITGGKA